MMSSKRSSSLRLHFLRLFYSLALVILFYLLFTSRATEVHTVWETMHSLFIPMFFIATSLLLAIVFSSEKMHYKLIFIIAHSVLSHAFFVIVFPTGNLGPQQVELGRARLVFDNITLHGNWWLTENILLQIYRWGRGDNFQSALSVILARMFGVDIYWSNLLLVPILWGVFVPVIAFMVSKTLGASENISIFSSLLASLFPANIRWGAESIPNSLSYLFFFCFFYFLLKYIKSNTKGVKDLSLVATFFFASFLSHYLAGTIALSLFILAYSVNTYEKQKVSSPKNARFMLLAAFIFCASIMPFALANRRLFYPWSNTHFSLEKIYKSQSTEMVLSLLLGNYFDLISREAYITTLIFGIAPLIGVIGLMFILIARARKSSEGSISPSVLFLSLGLLLIIVDDRIVKFFMINVPFIEYERLWLFRDFLLLSFTALVIGEAIPQIRTFFGILSKNIATFLRKKPSAHRFSKAFSYFTRGHLANGVTLGSVSAYILLVTVVSGWLTVSVYYAYPHWGPLQTTSYEVEAVKYIDETTNGAYIVICDQWMILTGQMFVGLNNPQSYYFSSTDLQGFSLCIKAKTNPSNQTMIEAMKINNATAAYFIIEKPRIGAETYNEIINRAKQNNLQTYKVFYHPENEEKLRIFYYLKP